MTTFTADAQQVFDHYLQTVRWSVRGVADPQEIERDVREHVATALESHDEPVTSQTLREVLSRLGDPWQWVAPEDLPLWRRIGMRFALGPEDWRLAYACFALTLLGMLLMPVGIGVVILMGAYFIARATYALILDRDGALGPRAWLICPPLVFWGIAVAGTLLIGPVAPIAAWGIGEHGFGRHAVPFNIGAVLAMGGAWWLMLSAFAAVFPGAVRALLLPMANRFRRVHAVWLAAIAIVLLAIGVPLLMGYVLQIQL